MLEEYCCTVVPSYPPTSVSFDRLLRSIGIGIMYGWNTSSLVFLSSFLTIQRMSWAGPIHPPWTQTTHCLVPPCRVGRRAQPGLLAFLPVGHVCSVSLFQRHEGRFEVLFSVVGVLKSLIICHLIDNRRIEKYDIPDLPSFQNSSRLSSIKR